MIEDWRQFLYPLGWLSGVAFSSRFLLQWIGSERAHKSIVTPLFWQISLLGNLALLLHAFIQLQYHICFVQVCNAVISWRNLDLMRPSDQRASLIAVLLILVSSIFVLTAAFGFQIHFWQDPGANWFRVPRTSWSPENLKTSYVWHAIGTMGLLLFNSRFWVQWWSAENAGRSYLGPAFWWISLFGALMCSAYFLKIYDWVNMMGPLFGIVPTIRNLMIIRNERLKGVRQQGR